MEGSAYSPVPWRDSPERQGFWFVLNRAEDERNAGVDAKAWHLINPAWRLCGCCYSGGREALAVAALDQSQWRASWGTRCADIAGWDGMGEGENIPGLHLEVRCRRSSNSMIDRCWRGFILMHRRRVYLHYGNQNGNRRATSPA